MIYLDNAATTKMSNAVWETVLKATSCYANPESLHKAGREAGKFIKSARETAAYSIYAKPENIIFTSGGSEANTLAIVGSAPYLKRIGKTHIITSLIEHESVLKAVEHLKEHEGFDISYVAPTKEGIVCAKDVMNFIKPETGFVSVMAVNNELGTENNFPEIARLCDDLGIIFHTDCVQAYMHIPISARFRGISMISVSSHKICGPKGVGFLYAADPSKLSSIIFGGSQEFGLRGGTENAAAIAGFGRAIAECQEKNQAENNAYLGQLVYALKSKLSDGIDGISINGSPRDYSNIINIRFENIDAETLVLMMGERGLCASAGSACTAHNSTPSHVLKAIGLGDDEARSSVRFSVSDYNTMEQISEAVRIIKDCVETLRHP